MKRIFLVCCAALLTLSGARSQNPELVNLDDKESWTMVIVPDPQSYVKFNRNQPLLDLQMQWIKDNTDRLNIGMVLCTGDLVEQNNILVPDGVNGNQTSLEQWNAVSRSFAILDTVVACIHCTGNHDYGVKSSENRYTQFNSFFPVQRNKATQSMLRGMIPNAEGALTMENAWFEFVSPHGVKFLIVTLEFNPRAAVVEQAKEVVNREEYKDHRVIYLTHSYLSATGERFVKENYPLEDVTHGEKLWTDLVQPAVNSAMVICGHDAIDFTFRGHVGYKESKNAAGKTVYEMMYNAQALGGGWHGNGGDGWLRILEFLPDGKTVRVKTFSPLFGISPETAHMAFRTEAFDQFEFKLD